MIRVLYSENGTLRDISSDLKRIESLSYALSSFVAADDAIYIGQDFPFNNFYLEVGDVVNTESTAMSAHYWIDTGWKEAVELIDETNNIANSGHITYVPDRDYVWKKENTSTNGGSVEGLSTVVIYDKYWLRLKFSSDITDNVTFKYLGHKFCDDNDLYTEFPQFSDTTYFAAFGSSKSDWIEQEVRASEILIQDLKKKRIIFNEGQILDRDDFRLACVSKTAQLIYSALGDDYSDDRLKASNEYKSRLKDSFFVIDKNNDASINKEEIISGNVGGLKR
jgi:hypothetical protein